MKNLTIILLIWIAFLGCSSTKEPIELKPVFVVLKASYEKSRMNDEGRMKERLVFMYKGDNGLTYEIEYYIGDRGILYVPR